MTLSEELRYYLDASGESLRALSLRAALNPKAVSDILNIPGLHPRHKTLAALSAATGRNLFGCTATALKTYADLIHAATTCDEKRDNGLASKLKWLCHNAGWSPELKIVCKQDVIDFFDAHNAVRFNLSRGSYATYRSALVKAAGEGQSRQRCRRIDDVGGIYRDVHAAIKDSDLAKSAKIASGSFLLFLSDHKIAPGNVTTETLSVYYNHRVKVSSKSAVTCEKHVREIASLLRRLAADPALARFGFTAAKHPFADKRNKFGVLDQAIASLLAEFDTRVGPWAAGLVSRDGQSMKDFISGVDLAEAAHPVDDKKSQLRARKKVKGGRAGQTASPVGTSVTAQLRQAGFIVGKARWSAKTLSCRRGYVISLAKAIIASTEVVPETFEELTDPEYLEIAVDTLAENNRGIHTSGYVASVLKTMKKIARDFVCRSPEDLQEIDDLIDLHEPGIKGIAPRNLAKLRQFSDARIQLTIDLSSDIVREVNIEIQRRRKAYQKKHSALPKSAYVIDAELARDIMAALAHDILLSRAPRSANLIYARLEWISWQGECARITVPAAEVKLRGPGDADLPILLDAATSRLLRRYVEDVRPGVLRDGDKYNPFLFPSQTNGQAGLHQPFKTVLVRVTRLLKLHVGVSINPHLYRHLIGWIWLRDSIDNLPKVKRILGHKSLQTTIDHYAQLDETLVMQAWQDRLNRKAAS